MDIPQYQLASEVSFLDMNGRIFLLQEGHDGLDDNFLVLEGKRYFLTERKLLSTSYLIELINQHYKKCYDEQVSKLGVSDG